MKLRYRRYCGFKVLTTCFACGAFSAGFFCGYLSSGWSTDTSGSTTIASQKEIALRATMIVVILSSPSNFLRRKIVRNTWLRTSHQNDSVRHIFVLGGALLSSRDARNLREEQERYGDLLVIDDLEDSYGSLSAKLLKCLSWIAENAEFKFLLKVDDDSFVHLSSLLSELTLRNQTNRLYLGFFDGRARVKKSGRWAEPHWFLCDRYLPYALGGGYVLTADLVQFVARNKHLLKLYRNEDVSLGVWLAPLDITRVHDPSFDTEYESRGCFNSYLVTHKQSPSQMIDKYNNLVRYGRLCESEFRSRKSYVYNWDVVPSLCCRRNDSSVP